MTQRIRNRLWALAAWICLGGACGTLAGYYYGRVRAEGQESWQLTQTALEGEDLLVTIVLEARTTLEELNSAHLPPCSARELAMLRSKAYNSRTLRDTGRIQGERMLCSALLDVAESPQAPATPAVTSTDGLTFYYRLPPYSVGKQRTVILRRGDFYVVLDPSLAKRLTEFPKSVEATTVDATTGARVRPSRAKMFSNTPVVDRDWQGTNGDTAFVTRCSPQTSMCVTAFSSISSSLKAKRTQIAAYAAAGCLLGAFPLLCGALILQVRQTTAAQLLRAIRKKQVQVVYQPIVELRTRRVVAAEALARWTDEDGNAVSPAAFVRVAEQRGFIGELTAMVLGCALEDFQPVLLSDREFQLNLNVTASDLQDAKFVIRVEEFLREFGVPADRIAFEVTEGSTAHKQLAIESIHELRRRGHWIEIDDFGTGYSSLAYLKDFPVDAIKIDQSFTQAIETHAVMGDILPQILSIAKALKLLVIVEGIETPHQAGYFANYEGPIHGQGWLFGRPVPADQFRRLWLDEQDEGSQAGKGGESSFSGSRA
ncbi:MAG TPA: EAL domain-containing protein [Terracidiphilus sp.]|nr:EAL domain-containing protein [Terracidiphilus sp.]